MIPRKLPRAISSVCRASPPGVAESVRYRMVRCWDLQVAGLNSLYEVKKCETWDATGTTCITENAKPVNSDLKQYWEEAYPFQHNCVVSLRKPGKPRSLSFCHKFNDDACCAPVMDDENTEMFGMLTGLGLSCRLRGDIREDPIAKWYCMNCDPQQPKYIRHIQKAGEGGGHADKKVLLVCQEWASDGFGVNPVLEGPGDRYNECGLLKSSPCLDVSGEGIPDRDRYTCGDDLVYPNSYRVESEETGLTDIVASLENFMNEDDMGVRTRSLRPSPRAQLSPSCGFGCRTWHPTCPHVKPAASRGTGVSG